MSESVQGMFETGGREGGDGAVDVWPDEFMSNDGHIVGAGTWQA